MLSSLTVPQNLPLTQIRPPKHRVREDVGDIEELKQSMKEQGLLQPLIVRKASSNYEIVAGHRRYLAAIELGWKEIDVREVSVSDKEAFEMSLLENIQRKSMDVIEEAKAFNQYVSVHKYGAISELARKIGKVEGYVRQRILLLNLPPDTSHLIRTDRLTPTHGTQLARLDNETATKMTELVVDKGLDTDTTRKAIDLVGRGFEPEQAIRYTLDHPDWIPPKEHTHYNPVTVARESIYLTLEKAIHSIDVDINNLPEKEQKAWIDGVRYPLHVLVNTANKLRKEQDKKK